MSMYQAFNLGKHAMGDDSKKRLRSLSVNIPTSCRVVRDTVPMFEKLPLMNSILIWTGDRTSINGCYKFTG